MLQEPWERARLALPRRSGDSDAPASPADSSCVRRPSPSGVGRAERPGKQRPWQHRSSSDAYVSTSLAPFGDASLGEAPFGDASFGEASFGDASFGDAPFGDAPFDTAQHTETIVPASEPAKLRAPQYTANQPDGHTPPEHVHRSCANEA